MATYWSKTLIPTSRQVPGDAVVPSHQLMLRAGMIRQLGSGMYSYLPLGLRALQKAMQIVREEMDNAGGIEVFLPTLSPIELWDTTGRSTTFGDNLFVIEDRHGKRMALGPTHEEVMTELVKSYVESYKQLPMTLYQIQTKFRDEYRPRFGVLRSREFQMKDAYSFDTTIEGLDASYDAMYNAYKKIFERCGLPYRIVEAESGPIGGSASHEFMVPSPTGEDTILSSDKLDENGNSNYSANMEKAEIGERPHDLMGEPTGDLEEVNTPNTPGIDDVVAFFKKELKTKLKKQNMLKTLVFSVVDPTEAQPKFVIAVVRSDHEVNEGKLRASTGLTLEMASDEAAREAGFAIGFVGPHALVGRNDVYLVVDHDAAQPGFWVAGGNKKDVHVKHFCWRRDLIAAWSIQQVLKMKAIELGKVEAGEDGSADFNTEPEFVADIRNAAQGDPSPKNDGGILQETKGIEIGHVFKLGCKYSDALEFEVSDDSNQLQSVLMGCYGIGVNRILAAALERDGGNDDNGIIWPIAIAPFTVIITAIKYEGKVKDVIDQIAAELESQDGIDVLIDDRSGSPGVKFKDADLIGIPIRITVGERGLKDGNVEIKQRTESDAVNVKVEEAATHVSGLLA
jgi:prolyl-tRNA synthetase